MHAFVPSLVGFFDSLDLPTDVFLVVHLGPAAELLCPAFLWADAQPFLCLPSSFHPASGLFGVEVDAS